MTGHSEGHFIQWHSNSDFRSTGVSPDLTDGAVGTRHRLLLQQLFEALFNDDEREFASFGSLWRFLEKRTANTVFLLQQTALDEAKLRKNIEDDSEAFFDTLRNDEAEELQFVKAAETAAQHSISLSGVPRQQWQQRVSEHFFQNQESQQRQRLENEEFDEFADLLNHVADFRKMQDEIKSTKRDINDEVRRLQEANMSGLKCSIDAIESSRAAYFALAEDDNSKKRKLGFSLVEAMRGEHFEKPRDRLVPILCEGFLGTSVPTPERLMIRYEGTEILPVVEENKYSFEVRTGDMRTEHRVQQAESVSLEVSLNEDRVNVTLSDTATRLSLDTDTGPVQLHPECSQNYFDPFRRRCDTCRPNSMCLLGTSATVPLRGFWQRTSVSTPVHCMPAEACVPRGQNTCADGYKGLQCARCADGFRRVGGAGGRCERCTSTHFVLRVLFVCALAVLFVAVCAWIHAPWLGGAVATIVAFQAAVLMLGHQLPRLWPSTAYFVEWLRVPPLTPIPPQVLLDTTFLRRSCGHVSLASEFWRFLSAVAVAAVCVALAAVLFLYVVVKYKPMLLERACDRDERILRDDTQLRAATLGRSARTSAYLRESWALRIVNWLAPTVRDEQLAKHMAIRYRELALLAKKEVERRQRQRQFVTRRIRSVWIRAAKRAQERMSDLNTTQINYYYQAATELYGDMAGDEEERKAADRILCSRDSVPTLVKVLKLRSTHRHVLRSLCVALVLFMSRHNVNDSIDGSAFGHQHDFVLHEDPSVECLSSSQAPVFALCWLLLFVFGVFLPLWVLAMYHRLDLSLSSRPRVSLPDNIYLAAWVFFGLSKRRKLLRLLGTFLLPIAQTLVVSLVPRDSPWQVALYTYLATCVVFLALSQHGCNSARLTPSPVPISGHKYRDVVLGVTALVETVVGAFFVFAMRTTRHTNAHFALAVLVVVACATLLLLLPALSMAHTLVSRRNKLRNMNVASDGEAVTIADSDTDDHKESLVLPEHSRVVTDCLAPTQQLEMTPFKKRHETTEVMAKAAATEDPTEANDTVAATLPVEQSAPASKPVIKIDLTAHRRTYLNGPFRAVASAAAVSAQRRVHTSIGEKKEDPAVNKRDSKEAGRDSVKSHDTFATESSEEVAKNTDLRISL
ncbi:MAG: hypothetical protein MHM6MM_000534 [Cercozoa sp. M6MM]